MYVFNLVPNAGRAAMAGTAVSLQTLTILGICCIGGSAQKSEVSPDTGASRKRALILLMINRNMCISSV